MAVQKKPEDDDALLAQLQSEIDADKRAKKGRNQPVTDVSVTPEASVVSSASAPSDNPLVNWYQRQTHGAAVTFLSLVAASYVLPYFVLIFLSLSGSYDMGSMTYLAGSYLVMGVILLVVGYATEKDFLIQGSLAYICIKAISLIGILPLFLGQSAYVLSFVFASLIPSLITIVGVVFAILKLTSPSAASNGSASAMSIEKQKEAAHEESRLFRLPIKIAFYGMLISGALGALYYLLNSLSTSSSYNSNSSNPLLGFGGGVFFAGVAGIPISFIAAIVCLVTRQYALARGYFVALFICAFCGFFGCMLAIYSGALSGL